VGAQGRCSLSGTGRGTRVPLTEDQRKQLSGMDVAQIVVAKSCYIEGKDLPTGEGNCLALRCGFAAQSYLFLLKMAILIGIRGDSRMAACLL
jgi:hypothetical protein